MRKQLFLILVVMVLDSCQGKKAPLLPILGKEELKNTTLYRGFDEVKNVNKDSVISFVIWGDTIKQLPEELTEFRNLQDLSIIMASLEELTPSVLKQLTRLQKLSLDNNSINNLPEEIGNLEYLNYLNLQHNKIKTLPKEIGNLMNLEYLNLDGNFDLIELPKEMSNLKKLKVLHLGYVELPEEEIFKLQKVLPNLKVTGVKGVILDSTYFSLTEEELMHLYDSLGGY